MKYSDPNLKIKLRQNLKSILKSSMFSIPSEINLNSHDLKFLYDAGFRSDLILNISSGKVSIVEIVNEAIRLGIEQGKSEKLKEIKVALGLPLN
jgi:hypothetical protein